MDNLHNINGAKMQVVHLFGSIMGLVFPSYPFHSFRRNFMTMHVVHFSRFPTGRGGFENYSTIRKMAHLSTATNTWSR